MMAGGGDPTDWVLDVVSLYDPATNAWTRGDNLATVRLGHTATLLPGGQVLLTGGWNYQDVQDSSELYSPTEGRPIISQTLVNGRAWHTATLLGDGAVLLTGGVNLDGPLRSTELLVRTTRARLKPLLVPKP
jgi:N-acetylneuraminic acid mutarotase